MDHLPHREPVLESVRKGDVSDNLWSESMASSTPQSGQPKLGIHAHLRLFQKSFSRMVKLANEGKVELRLPLLDQCEFHGPKVIASREERKWTPNEEVIMVEPKTK